MEEKTNKKPLKAAVIAGISTFGGMAILFPLMLIIDGMRDLKNFGEILTTFVILLGYFIFFGTGVIGLLEAVLIAAVVYFIFKFLVPNNATKKQLRVLTITIAVICAIIGLLSFSPIDKFMRELMFGKEHVGTVDANRDGKPEKWVHNDIYDRLTEVDYDTNLDGKPDVWEYYKNSEVYKKEIDTNFDGKPDKVENYK